MAYVYNSETQKAELARDTKEIRYCMPAGTAEIVKIASKESGITLKESILLSYDKMVFHLNAGTTKEDIRMIVEVLNDFK